MHFHIFFDFLGTVNLSNSKYCLKKTPNLTDIAVRLKLEINIILLLFVTIIIKKKQNSLKWNTFPLNYFCQKVLFLDILGYYLEYLNYIR